MQLDHVVLWVEDPSRSVAFFHQVVGFEPLRLAEYEAKQTMFPSVRVNATTIIDLIPKAAAPRINALPGAAGTAGHPTNHLCFAMSEAAFHALAQRLEANGTPGGHRQQDQYGARGSAPHTFYFRDPDGNVLEARYYTE